MKNYFDLTNDVEYVNLRPYLDISYNEYQYYITESELCNISTKEEKQQAAETALYKTQQTNGGAVTETGARHAQNDLGRVALMYKNYGIQMYYTMFKSS